jgi:DNA adenine methylase
VNKYGQFNVPLGKYKNPLLYNLEELWAASRVLQNAELFAEDYHTFLKRIARPGDFIYLDPPYIPIIQTLHKGTISGRGSACTGTGLQ